MSTSSSLGVHKNRVIFLQIRTALAKADKKQVTMAYLHGPERQAAGWQALHGLRLQDGVRVLQAHEGREDRDGGAASWS